MKKTITLKITVDSDRQETFASRTGCKLPLSYIQSADPGSVAEVMRDAAFGLLEMAHCQEHLQDFLMPDFDAMAQVRLMLAAHKPIFQSSAS